MGALEVVLSDLELTAVGGLVEERTYLGVQVVETDLRPDHQIGNFHRSWIRKEKIRCHQSQERTCGQLGALKSPMLPKYAENDIFPSL